MSGWLWLAVLGIGGCGAIGRFVLDAVVSEWGGRGFPFGTLAINLTGTLALGLLTGLGVTGNVALLVGTAAIGSYTTFSTWMLETYRLAEDASFRAAFANAVVSLVLGFAAALLGRTIGIHL